MFQSRPIIVATGLLFVGPLRAAGAESGAGSCDSASGTCAADAGDDMSAMQLKWGPEPDTPTPAPNPDADCPPGGEADGCGKWWELVDASTLGETLPYSKKGKPYPEDSDPIPWCFQGLFYLDQMCTTYPKMPRSEREGKCLGTDAGHFWVNEFVTGFGSWDEKTRCFNAERKPWVFGQGNSSDSICKGAGIRACMEPKGKAGWRKDPCAPGATYYALDFPKPFTWYFVKTKSAWDRKTPSMPFGYNHYPVQTIVNATGHKTEWYQDMLDEVLRPSCPEGSENNARADQKPPCRRSLYAKEGKIARCTRSSW